MKKNFVIDCLKLYIKDHAKDCMFLFTSALIFAVVLYLYNGPMEAFAYALLLCICLGGGIFAMDFRRFYLAHKQLISSLETISLTLDGMPSAGRTLARDYEDLVHRLYEELNRTVNEAESSRRYISDYYALWIHQIKIPISAMYLLMGENARTSALGIELFKIEQYVEMALSYVRMESTSTDYVFKEYDIERIVKQSVRKHAPLFISKKLSVDIKPMNLKAITDEKWLSFVIDQILSNSLKYTKSGGITIYAHSDAAASDVPACGTPAGNAAASDVPACDLIIKDTGIGIAPEDIKRLGEKGFTGYNGRDDKKSTGLGLYMSYEILGKLSHSMDIESKIGKGTRVVIHLGKQATRAE